jgi:hypothetical protein
MFTTLGASFKTSYELLAQDVDSEVERRIFENENGYDEIFAPRITANTASGASTGSGSGSGGDSDGVRQGNGGRTAMDPDEVQLGPDKQESDAQRYDDMKNM